MEAINIFLKKEQESNLEKDEVNYYSKEIGKDELGRPKRVFHTIYDFQPSHKPQKCFPKQNSPSLNML